MNTTLLVQLHIVGREQALARAHVADPPVLVGELDVRDGVALVEGEF